MKNLKVLPNPDILESDFEFLTRTVTHSYSTETSLGISDNPHFEVLIDALWLQKRSRDWFFVSLHLTKSKLTSTNHECPMSRRFPERCLTFKTLFLLQKRLMSSMASQNTGRKYAPLKTNRAWFGQFVWIHGTSSQGFHHQFPDGKEEVLKYTKQMLSNALRAKSILVVVGEKVGRLWCVSGGNLPRRITSPLHMLLLFVVSPTRLTQTNVTFNQNTLEELPPKPLRLASFITQHCVLVLFHVEHNHCDGFIDLHGRGQGLAAESIDGSHRKKPVKSTQTTKCCGNPKLTT